MSRQIDWKELLTTHRVPFIERGANVKRGEVNVRCVFCGSSDPSFHMGINTENGWWSCWRNRAEHSGKSPVRLILALLKVSYAEALQIAGLDSNYVDPDGFQALAAQLRQKRGNREVFEQEYQLAERPPLRMDRAFEVLTQKGPMRKHFDYLDNRWFDPHQLATEYGVMCGIEGWWRDRVIFPYIEEERLVTWTGRACGRAEVRYQDLPIKPPYDGYRGELARVAAKETLFNHDAMLAGGRWLILVEGPVDALKLDCYGKEYGVRAVALSTSSISDGQLARLDKYESNFDRFGVMMDMSNRMDFVNSMTMRGRLSSIKHNTIGFEVPNGRKDAGELNPREVRAFCKTI